MKKWIIVIAVIALLSVIVTLILAWKYTDNTGILITNYQISNQKIPAAFDGFRIVQIADLHNTEFEENNARLISLLAECDPDIIVFTGDQVDARTTKPDVVLKLAEQALKIAPCYMVTGNHEGSIVQLSQLQKDLRALGVLILENEVLELSRSGESVSLIGVNDPTLNGRYFSHGPEGAIDATLEELTWAPDRYCILLSHHPEYLQTYAKHGVDLALCGHAHGGQVRIGQSGIIAPHQGLFPKYTAGQYTMDDTTMILSRGLGNSLFPWRINNPPELVVIELQSE